MSTLGLAAIGLAAVFSLVVMATFPNVRSTIFQMVMGMFILLLGLTLVGLLVIVLALTLLVMRGSRRFVYYEALKA